MAGKLTEIDEARRLALERVVPLAMRRLTAMRLQRQLAAERRAA